MWKEERYALTSGELCHFSAKLCKSIELWVVVLPSQEEVNECADPGGVRVKEFMTDRVSYSLTVWGTDPEGAKLRAYSEGRKKFLEILEATYGATLEAS